MRLKTLTLPDELLEGLIGLVKKNGIKIIIEDEQKLRKLGIEPRKAERVLEQWLFAELSAQVLEIKEDDIK